MKRGTFVINPYVNPYYFGNPNPNYKTMFWKCCGKIAKCIDFKEGSRTLVTLVMR